MFKPLEAVILTTFSSPFKQKDKQNLALLSHLHHITYLETENLLNGCVLLKSDYMYTSSRYTRWEMNSVWADVRTFQGYF